MKVTVLLVCGAISAALVSSAAAGVLRADRLTIKLGERGEVTALTDQSGGLSLAPSGQDFRLTDGRTGREIAPVFKGKTGESAFAYQAGDGLSVDKSYRAHGDYISCLLSFTNAGREQKWLAVRYSLPRPTGAGVRFWDGNTEQSVVGGKELVRADYIGMFPMCCVYGESSGIAVGFNPGAFFSYLETGCGDGGFYYGHRLVLDPGQTAAVEYVVYTFPSDYGFLNALEAYYRMFPDYFRPAPGVDKRVYTTTDSMGYSDWQWIYEQDAEMIRRLHIGWSWFYAPFKRAGDFFGRPENWTWEPKINRDQAPKSALEEFLAARKERIQRAERYDVGIMYYIIDNCEWDLANEKYKDCITVDTDFQTVRSPWVHSYSADTVMFWWNNKFAEDTKSDLLKIVRAYPNQMGFAVDCAEAHCKHRGAGMNETEGRAWDEKGVYINEQVGIGKMMDFIHGLKKDDGRTVGITCNHNGPSAYVTAFRADQPINENGYALLLTQVEKWKADKYLLGRKPKVLFSAFNQVKLGDMMDWKAMSREELRRNYGLIQSSLFDFCLYLGYVPTPWIVAGHVRFMDNLDLLYELIGLGWRALPAMKGDGRLWYSRYGDDLDTCLAVSNPTVGEVQSEVAVDNKYLGPGAHIFTTHDGAGAVNKIADGRTVLSCRLKEKEFRVWRSVLSIGGLAGGTAEAVLEDDIGRVLVRIKIRAPRGSRVSLRCPPRPDAGVTAVSVNGRPVAPRAGSGPASYEAALRAGDNAITIEYRSRKYRFGRKELAAVAPAVDPGAGTVPVVVGEGLAADFSNDDYVAAWQVSEYFRHAYAKTLPDETALVRPLLVNVSQSGRGPAGIFILTPDQARVRKLDVAQPNFISLDEHGAIVVCGETARLRRTLVKDLLFCLDTKFHYYGGIGGTRWFFERNKETAESALMREKGGIKGGEVFHD